MALSSSSAIPTFKMTGSDKRINQLLTPEEGASSKELVSQSVSLLADSLFSQLITCASSQLFSPLASLMCRTVREYSVWIEISVAKEFFEWRVRTQYGIFSPSDATQKRPCVETLSSCLCLFNFQISRRSLPDSCRQLKNTYLILLWTLSAPTINNTRTEQYEIYWLVFFQQ